ncbi:hypothetical protein IG631_13064 [Alternaria alternata]|nr:hypothetical protein IG631_13064 [Alternaria alternata]
MSRMSGQSESPGGFRRLSALVKSSGCVYAFMSRWVQKQDPHGSAAHSYVESGHQAKRTLV